MQGEFLCVSFGDSSWFKDQWCFSRLSSPSRIIWLQQELAMSRWQSVKALDVELESLIGFAILGKSFHISEFLVSSSTKY